MLHMLVTSMKCPYGNHISTFKNKPIDRIFEKIDSRFTRRIGARRTDYVVKRASDIFSMKNYIFKAFNGVYLLRVFSGLICHISFSESNLPAADIIDLEYSVFRTSHFFEPNTLSTLSRTLEHIFIGPLRVLGLTAFP